MKTFVQPDRRSEVHYASVDSAPKRFAGPVPQWTAPAMLALFSLLSLGLLWLVNTPTVSQIFPNRDLVFSPYSGHHSIAVRIFILAFFMAFATFAQGSIWARLKFGLDMIFTFFVMSGILDAANIIMSVIFDVHYSLDFGAILSGLAGFSVFSLKLLERGAMPSRIRIERGPIRLGLPLVRIAGVTIIATLVAWQVSGLDLWAVTILRNYALLGGIGPGVFLFLPTFFGLLYLIARIDILTTDPVDFTPAVTVIIPAHNEQYIIADTINALDLAAKEYAGNVELLILNSNSSDDTSSIAQKALDACKAAKGRVIDVRISGKAHALNIGLDAVKTRFLIRVDADTLVGKDNLTRAMVHFANPRVGVVGGVPIPPGGGMFDRPRLLEVLVKHGFYSIAMGAIHSVIGIPGMFVAYRTLHPRQLGGFVQGMNGEDTDISLRIGELGFDSVVDPKIRYVSEVPTSYRHMREQRMRWFRSVFHISSRCRDLIYSETPTLRGKIILPYMLVNSARRAMLIPLIIFGLIEYLTGLNPDTPIVWQSILAAGVGAPAIMAVVACFINSMPRAIFALPEYLIFRLLRAYFTLESMLSILIKRDGRKLNKPILEDTVSDKPMRIA